MSSVAAEKPRVNLSRYVFQRDAQEKPLLSLRTLRWLTVVAPFVFLAMVDALRHNPPLSLLHEEPASLALLALVGGSIALFSKAVLDQVAAMQQRVLEQNQALAAMSAAASDQAGQLRGLHHAGLSLAADLSLEAVLQRVVDLARELAGAQYGALGVFDEYRTMERFVTSGIPQEERARIGAGPSGRGLLGKVLDAAGPLRVADIADHPDAVGFPPGHPSMSSFLGVPITYKGRVLGNLYLTNKRGAQEFSDADAAVLELFAAQAAVAIENARLHAQVQRLAIEEERQRIAREMHDGMAQILGYVNMKAAAARRLADQGRVQEAAKELQQLEDAARDLYVEVREAILGLRTITQGSSGLLAVLRGYLERFSELTSIPVALELACEESALSLRPEEEVQLIRIIQEALSNVRKHAQARQATVRLDVEPQETLLVIADDGRGFSPDRSSSRGGPQFGLQTMRERAEALGGSFALDTAPGRGTRVMVRLPHREER